MIGRILFWLFCLAMDLLIPATMFFFGRRFLTNPPKTINGVYGYRTSRSMKNQQTWDFAHQVCGQVWMKAGKWMALPSVLAMLVVVGQDVGVVGTVCGVVTGVQCVVMLGTIVPVEQALKQNFDRFGRKLET